MNKGLVMGLSAMVGAVAGSLATYVITRKVILKEADLIIKEEVDSIRNAFKDIEVQEIEDDYREPEVYTEPSRHGSSLIDDIIKEKDTMIKVMEEEGYVVDGFIDYDKLVKPQKDRAFPITYNMFQEDEDEYEKNHAEYLSGEDKVRDDNGERMYDYREVVGEVKTYFGKLNSDPNVCYVRNPMLKMDFEISLVLPYTDEEV